MEAILYACFCFNICIALTFKHLDPLANREILVKEITIKGFLVYSFDEEWPAAFVEMNKLIQEVKLRTTTKTPK